jgi:hypothetical protein
MFNVFSKINNFFYSFFDFLPFRTKVPILNNDVESCCLLNDDTTTYSE